MRNRSARWHIRDGRPRTGVPAGVRDWLVATGSLTGRLRRDCRGAFRVRVLGQGWQRPTLEEAVRLGVDRRRRVWTREVALCCGDSPRILARTVVPARSLRGGNGMLQRLGSRPLGQLLFRGGGSAREALELARLRGTDELARRLGAATGLRLDDCWARRRIHYLRGRPLLVAEVFLPEVFGRDAGRGVHREDGDDGLAR